MSGRRSMMFWRRVAGLFGISEITLHRGACLDCPRFGPWVPFRWVADLWMWWIRREHGWR